MIFINPDFWLVVYIAYIHDLLKPVVYLLYFNSLSNEYGILIALAEESVFTIGSAVFSALMSSASGNTIRSDFIILPISFFFLSSLCTYTQACLL